MTQLPKSMIRNPQTSNAKNTRTTSNGIGLHSALIPIRVNGSGVAENVLLDMQRNLGPVRVTASLHKEFLDMPVGDDTIKRIIPLNEDVLECLHQPGLTLARKLLMRNGLARSVSVCLLFIENSLVHLDPGGKIGSTIGISSISRSKVAEGDLNMGFMRSAIQRKLVYPTWNANCPVFLLRLYSCGFDGMHVAMSPSKARYIGGARPFLVKDL